MRLIAKNLKGKVAQLVLGPLFKLLEAVLELFVPVVMAHLIDEGIRGNTSVIWQDGLLLAALAVGGILSAMICQYFAARTAGHFGLGLRRQLYEHVMKLSGSETAQFGAGGLITRVTNDANQIQTGLNMFIRLGVRVPFLIIGGLVMALSLNWRIGLIFLVASPLIGLALFIIMKKTLPSYGRIQAKQDDLARLSGENLAGARVIRAFSRQRDETDDFDASAGELTSLLVRVGRISAALNPLTSFIVAGATVGIVYLGGYFTYSGQSTPGEVFAMVSYMNQIMLAMIVAANLIVLFTRAVASTRRVADLLRVRPSIVDGPGAVPLPNAAALEFRKVDFAYHEGAGHALEGVGFSIARGETVGVIGGTGSGKTTLVNLMMRYFDVTDGAVLCDGADVRDYTLHSLRAKFGLVPQMPTLLSGTVRHNLMLGAPDATDEELWQALRTAQAEDFVKGLSGGLDAEVREGGKNLSGGQKQRLAIARALARRPEILLLDDAASALDYATDARLRAALRRQARESEVPMTTVIISQRAASIRGADTILVLDDGQLVGAGSHEKLLATNEVYRQICISQGLAPAAGNNE